MNVNVKGNLTNTATEWIALVSLTVTSKLTVGTIQTAWAGLK